MFIGHSVTFINDSYPPATASTGKLQTEQDWNVEPTSTILANVVIGAEAIVGAGSVVTRDVPARTVVAGNPPRILRRLAAESGSDQ